MWIHRVPFEAGNWQSWASILLESRRAALAVKGQYPFVDSDGFVSSQWSASLLGSRELYGQRTALLWGPGSCMGKGQHSCGVQGAVWAKDSIPVGSRELYGQRTALLWGPGGCMGKGQHSFGVQGAAWAKDSTPVGSRELYLSLIHI